MVVLSNTSRFETLFETLSLGPVYTSECCPGPTNPYKYITNSSAARISPDLTHPLFDATKLCTGDDGNE
jgi:hypothetical protein